MFWKLRNPIIFFLFSCYEIAFSLNGTLELDFRISGDQSGFHRIICYSVDVLNINGGSSILIKEILPKDMYVDPYQVSNEVLIKESVDCEIPAYLGSELEVQLCSSSETHAHHVCIPVHFRYQLPHYCEVNGKSVLVKMSTPSVFIKTGRDHSNGLYNDCFMDMESWIYQGSPKVKCLDFQIPVGCTEHFYPVLLLTVLTVTSSVVYLLFILVKTENEFKITH